MSGSFISKLFRKDSGFTLIEVVMAGALVGFVGLAVSRFSGNASKMTRRMQEKTRFYQFTALAQNTIHSREKCTTAFREAGGALAKFGSGVDTVEQIVNTSSQGLSKYVVLLDEASDNPLMSISDISFELAQDNTGANQVDDDKPFEGFRTQLVNLFIEMSRNEGANATSFGGGEYSNKVSPITFPLITKMDTNEIVGCWDAVTLPDGTTLNPGGDDSGGSTDAGTTDAGTTDAGTTDAGTTDSGSTDSGSTDSGSTDSGSTDAGTTDSGSTDSGSTDSGTTPSGGTATTPPCEDTTGGSGGSGSSGATGTINVQCFIRGSGPGGDQRLPPPVLGEYDRGYCCFQSNETGCTEPGDTHCPAGSTYDGRTRNPEPAACVPSESGPSQSVDGGSGSGTSQPCDSSGGGGGAPTGTSGTGGSCQPETTRVRCGPPPSGSYPVPPSAGYDTGNCCYQRNPSTGYCSEPGDAWCPSGYSYSQADDRCVLRDPSTACEPESGGEETGGSSGGGVNSAPDRYPECGRGCYWWQSGYYCTHCP